MFHISTVTISVSEFRNDLESSKISTRTVQRFILLLTHQIYTASIRLATSWRKNKQRLVEYTRNYVISSFLSSISVINLLQRQGIHFYSEE